MWFSRHPFSRMSRAGGMNLIIPAWLASSGKLCAGPDLRQAWNRHVGSGRRTSRLGAAYGRPTRGHGRRRDGAGRAHRYFRRRFDGGFVRRYLPEPVPRPGAHRDLRALFVLRCRPRKARRILQIYRGGVGQRRAACTSSHRRAPTIRCFNAGGAGTSGPGQPPPPQLRSCV